MHGSNWNNPTHLTTSFRCCCCSLHAFPHQGMLKEFWILTRITFQFGSIQIDAIIHKLTNGKQSAASLARIQFLLLGRHKRRLTFLHSRINRPKKKKKKPPKPHNFYFFRSAIESHPVEHHNPSPPSDLQIREIRQSGSSETKHSYGSVALWCSLTHFRQSSQSWGKSDLEQQIPFCNSIPTTCSKATLHFWKSIGFKNKRYHRKRFTDI